MKISSYLSKDLIFLNLEANSVEETIIKSLSKAKEVDKEISQNYEQIVEAVLKREKEMSTNIGNQVIIPHGRLESYNDIAVIFGTLNHPFTIIDKNKEEEISMFFLIVSNITKNRMMLKFMSSIAFLSSNSEFVSKAKNIQNKDELIDLVVSFEKEVKENLTSEDFMDTTTRPVALDTTLEEVATRLIQENKTGFPVVDESGAVIGEITEKELIEFGMPKYASLISDLSFMTIGEPFEEYFKHEKTVFVRDLYRNVNNNIVDEKASIMEISFKIITESITRLYVVDDNKKYKGMIERSYIIKKYLHI